MKFSCTKDDAGRRIDKIVRRLLPDYPLSKIYSLFRGGDILLNGKKTKPDIRIAENQIIEIKHIISPHSELLDNPILNSPVTPPPFEIVFESDAILVVNKKAGIEVIGDASLETQVSDYLKNKIRVSLSFRPGPLHRLDKPTSGIVIFGKNLEASQYISELFKPLAAKHITKTYQAILDGRLESDIILELLMYRDKALKKTFVVSEKSQEPGDSKVRKTITRVRPKEHFQKRLKDFTFAEIQIETGFTHQIRAACSHLGYPLAGDKKYGSHTTINYPASAFFLHAEKIVFPIDEKRPEGIPDFVEASTCHTTHFSIL
jgi:23S rRNA pseudouridine955/2504/2580 synthase